MLYLRLPADPYHPPGFSPPENRGADVIWTTGSSPPLKAFAIDRGNRRPPKIRSKKLRYPAHVRASWPLRCVRPPLKTPTPFIAQGSGSMTVTMTEAAAQQPLGQQQQLSKLAVLV